MSVPTVSVTHWDPEVATNSPPEDWEDQDASLYEMGATEYVLPVCPECESRVEGYAYPGEDEEGQTVLPEWLGHVVINLRPCNHEVRPEEIGLHRYNLQTKLVTHAPRP